MTQAQALHRIMAIASYTPMQTEVQTAGQMGRIMRVAEEALARTTGDHSMSAQQIGRWISFDDQVPPHDTRLDDPKVGGPRPVLVTNNMAARDAMGRMSHVWFVMPIKSKADGWVAYDAADRQICGLTHWLDPLGEPQP